MEKNESLFIGIRDPLELRRDLLECSKAAVISLRKFEEQKALHEEKLKTMNRLKLTVRELQRLMGKLRILLPKAKVAEIIEERKRIETMIPHMHHVRHKMRPTADAPQAQDAAPQVAQVPRTEIDRLEAELADIEEKLKKLS